MKITQEIFMSSVGTFYLYYHMVTKMHTHGTLNETCIKLLL